VSGGTRILIIVGYILLGPIVGGLLDGLDRKLTARFQSRVGPPLLQPFHDLRKLFSRRIPSVNRLQIPLVASHLIFAVVTGALFFEGSDILLIIFVLTLSGIFLVLAAYSTGSPFGAIGADRELLLMLAYEPMIILVLVGLYDVTKGFNFYDIMRSPMPAILYLPGIYLCIVVILLMKLRKSPFDISTSHHAHQELVKGLTVDMGGPALGLVELAHWYESTYLYALVFLFFSSSPVASCLGVVFTWLFVILIDNTTARVKWEFALGSAWILALVVGAGNLIPFYLITRGR
jgi:formate hydrogenlyase subunit 4